MCARFTAGQTQQELEELFGLTNVPDWMPRYNVAPSQLVPVLRLTPSSQRELARLRWGFVPKWAKADSPQALAGLVNAKSETAWDKPAFREAMQLRRCLVPADGFIEWETLSGEKQPHYFYLAEKKPFAFAAIWEPPAPEGRHPTEATVAILTTAASLDVAPFHDRMPVILRREQFDCWLQPNTPRDSLEPMLASVPVGSILSHPVSRAINKTSADGPELLAPIRLGLFG